MEACNGHYYATRDPLGAAGDFTTAPEISQMFGELVGASLADAWHRAGRPDAAYAELGPGRATLAADALRVLRRAGFNGGVHLVETSPTLRQVQARSVPDAEWHDTIAGLPERPLLAVANEFLDALPVRQFVDGIERRVAMAGGRLAFDRDGDIMEDSPARQQAVCELSRHLVRNGGIAIIIDYGHRRTAAGDTLQAVRGHRFASVLENPGEQDLTSHVNFEAVARAAVAEGALVTPTVTQGTWLEALGIGARAVALTNAHPHRSEEIAAARARLCDADQMGELFKVVAIRSPGWPPLLGFEE